MSDNKGQNTKSGLKKLNGFLGAACVAIIVSVVFCRGVDLITTYGIPTDNREMDMQQVLNGIGMIVLVSVFLLVDKRVYLFLVNFGRKPDDYSIDINLKGWPVKSLRTVQKTLMYMSKKIGLKVCNIVVSSILISLVIFIIPRMGEDAADYIDRVLAVIGFLAFWLVIRMFVILSYQFPNYTTTMLLYSKEYVGITKHHEFLNCLQRSLKERLVYYSSQWIITEDFFIAWCESDMFFHPIAVPIKEIHHLKYDIKIKTVRGSQVHSAVIVCRLHNGKSVDLYAGNEVKINVIWIVLRYFEIPFENTLTPDEYYEVPFEITVTPPESTETENRKATDLEAVIKKMDAKDIEKIYRLLESEQKIMAIKEIMEATGLGSDQAKQIADDYHVLLGNKRYK